MKKDSHNIEKVGTLADPKLNNQPLDISSFNTDDIKSFYERMVLIRKSEEELAKYRENGVIGGPVHLGGGQEAIAVGVSFSLKKTDRIFGTHRSHPHLLAVNPDPYRLFAEVLGKDTGFSKGMGGSMHLWDKPNGFYGAVPIVGATIPLAVGAGLAAKMTNTKDIGLAYLGDGAAEEGIFHESLNLARVQKVPILFVVENNFFSSHMHISERQPTDLISRFAKANDITSKLVDGNDVCEVANAAKDLINYSRNGNGPALLEAITYRSYGHVDWRQDIDVGVNRSMEDLNDWNKRDPIARLKASMLDSDFWSEEEDQFLMEEIDKLIKQSWQQADNDEYPVSSRTKDYVFYSSK